MTNLNKTKCIIEPHPLYRLALKAARATVGLVKFVVELVYYPRWYIVHFWSMRSE